MKAVFTGVLGSIALTALLFAAAVGALPASPHSAKAEKVPGVGRGALDPGELVLTGEIRPHRVVISTSDLAALPQQELTVTFRSGPNILTRTERGPLLVDVLNTLAEPKFDPDVNNHRLRFFVTAVGSDGYAAVVAYGEIDPGFGNRQAILALAEEGVALTQPRLIVPGDIRGGRFVTDIVKIELGKARG